MIATMQSASRFSDPANDHDISPEAAWVSFACAVLPPLVAEQKAAFGTYSSPNAIAQVADEAGQFATAMLKVWRKNGVAR